MLAKTLLATVVFLAATHAWSFEGCLETLNPQYSNRIEPILTHECQFEASGETWSFHVQGYANAMHIITEQSRNYLFSESSGLILQIFGSSEISATLYQPTSLTRGLVRKYCKDSKFVAIARQLNGLRTMPGTSYRSGFDQLVKEFKLDNGEIAVLSCRVKR